MSAFMVSQAHLDALLSLALWGPEARDAVPGRWVRPRWFAVPPSPEMDLHTLQQANRTISPQDVHEVGQMFADANARSLRCRYRTGAEEMIPEWAARYRFHASLLKRRPTPVEGLKLVACLRYQACECPEWRESEAVRFCEALEHALIGCLPGYDKAPWQWPG